MLEEQAAESDKSRSYRVDVSGNSVHNGAIEK